MNRRDVRQFPTSRRSSSQPTLWAAIADPGPPSERAPAALTSGVAAGA